ncbi:MAG: AGE family epimerase/isomerase, partial [Firmicutes bacterium]|nr:AGE family epimerase/isomerase [Bacillota bacterium]
MDKKRVEQLYEYYKKYLLQNCISFWLKNSLDYEYGGYLTCLDREGKVYNTDKSIWFQGRGTWIYSKLYNVVEKRQEWIDAAKIGYDFLLKYGFDSDGRMFFQVTRDGKPLQKRRYVFSEMFAIMAFKEFYKATGRDEAYNMAITTYDTVLDIYRNPSKIVPKIIPETRRTKSHSFF